MNECLCRRSDARVQCTFEGGPETFTVYLLCNFDFPDGERIYEGTGSITRLSYEDGKKGKWFIETCAHNFIQY